MFVEDDELGVYNACHFTGSWRQCSDQAQQWNLINEVVPGPVACGHPDGGAAILARRVAEEVPVEFLAAPVVRLEDVEVGVHVEDVQLAVGEQR